MWFNCVLGIFVVFYGFEYVMGECDYEEVDICIVVYVWYVLERGVELVFVRIVDIDVVVILVGKFYDFLVYNYLCKVWVVFGMGCYFLVININGICFFFGEFKFWVILVFYVFIGCDCIL